MVLSLAVGVRGARADDAGVAPPEAGSNVDPGIDPNAPPQPLSPPTEPPVPVVVPPPVAPDPVPPTPTPTPSSEPGSQWVSEPAKRDTSEKPPSRPRPTLGYRAYEGAFYDIGYGRESAPWVSPDGKTAIGLGGLRLFESHGIMVNTVVMFLAIVGGGNRPLTASRTDASGNVWVNKAAEDKAQAERISAIVEGAKQSPFSLEIRGYHDSLGSEVNGLSFDMTLSSSMYDAGTKHYGISGGNLSSNRNYVPAVDAPMEFSRWWFGAVYDYRRRLYQKGSVLVGFHGHVMLAFADPWIALLTLGPEIAITDRFHISACASQDLHRFDLSNGMGYRGQIGMRF